MVTTTFKKMLIDKLEQIARAREMDECFVQMEYVEGKADVIGEILDYYTEELLKYQPFAAEFRTLELEALRGFVLFLRNDRLRGAKTWPEIHLRAAELLKCLEGA